MQNLAQLTDLAREVVYYTLREVIANWKKLSSHRKHVEEYTNKLSLSDDIEVHRVYALIRKRSVDTRKVFQEFLVSEPLYGELYDKLSRNMPFQEDFLDLLAHQAVFALALSPSYLVAEERCKFCDSSLLDKIEYTISDLLEGIITQFVLGRHSVAHVYVYGSSRFRHRLIIGQRRGTLDPEKIHEPTVLKELAPPLYAYLASLNLVSNAIDEKMKNYDILGKLALSRIQEKVIVLMGLGNAFAKSLLSGLIYKTADYIRPLFASILLADALIANIADILERRGASVSSIMGLVVERYYAYQEHLETVLNKYSLIKGKTVVYEVWDAVRDVIIKYMIHASQIHEEEIKLSDALTFRLP